MRASSQRRPLTRKEVVLAYHVYKGKNNLEISLAMGNARGTVKGNLIRVYKVLGIDDSASPRVELATWFARQVMKGTLIEEGYVYLTGENSVSKS